MNRTVLIGCSRIHQIDKRAAIQTEIAGWGPTAPASLANGRMRGHPLRHWSEHASIAGNGER